jgi:hypothetical protein
MRLVSRAWEAAVLPLNYTRPGEPHRRGPDPRIGNSTFPMEAGQPRTFWHWSAGKLDCLRARKPQAANPEINSHADADSGIGGAVAVGVSVTSNLKPESKYVAIGDPRRCLCRRASGCCYRGPWDRVLCRATQAGNLTGPE